MNIFIFFFKFKTAFIYLSLNFFKSIYNFVAILIFDDFLLKSFDIADNVVFFCPLTKVFKGKKLDVKISNYGGIKEIIHMGGGNQHGFPFGFSTGCIHYQKNYKGNIKLTRNY